MDGITFLWFNFLRIAGILAIWLVSLSGKNVFISSLENSILGPIFPLWKFNRLFFQGKIIYQVNFYKKRMTREYVDDCYMYM